MRITLIDRVGDLATEWRKLVPEGVEVIAFSDVREVPLEPGTAFVSPANSLGFMDGGIDYVYMLMFPGIETAVKGAIAKRGQLSGLGRPWLPIGEALVVPVPNGTPRGGVSLVCAPTMLMPMDVNGTSNAYNATHAAIVAALAAGVRRLVIPGMCTGCGAVPAAVAASQMAAAIAEALGGKPRRMTLAEILAEQPNVYAKTEFATVDPAEIHHTL